MPKDIRFLKAAGIDVLSLANNHILDYGEQGVSDTLELCRNENMGIVGGGKDEESANKPYFISIKKRTIGILSFAEAEFNIATQNTAGANHFNYYESFQRIKATKEKCDYLIVLYHGGIEHYSYPSPLLQIKCRKMAEFGADIILCQHSHCIGTIEKYNNATILYGQGNSVFGYRKDNTTWNEGLLVEVTLKEKSPEISLSLLKATKKGIDLAEEVPSKTRIDKMNEMSLTLSNALKIQEMWNQFCNEKAALYLPLLYGKGRVFNKLNRILHNNLIDLFFSKKKKVTTMNLIRCEAHNEVVQTILKDHTSYYLKSDTEK